MNKIFFILASSAATSVLLVMFGIFWVSGMTLPMEARSYGFVIEMLKNPAFQLFHFKAFMWLFSSGAISSATTLYLVSHAQKNT